MLRKLISAVMVIACLFMLVAGAFGIRDIMQEKSDGEKEKAATLEKRRARPVMPTVRRHTSRAKPTTPRVSRISGTGSRNITTARQRSNRARPTMPPVKSSLPMGRNSTMQG